MITVISPAKRLSEAPVGPVGGMALSRPVFAADANRLARIARTLSVPGLQALMGISEPLARLNAERFQAFRLRPAPAQVRPAAFLFAGDTYQGLRIEGLDPAALAWAQDRLRILSGLYGLLRPLDAIQPYRLEMGSRLATPHGGTLYAYWGTRLARTLNAEAKRAGTDVIVNCASVEYIGAVDGRALKPRLVTPVFLEERGNEAKVVSFSAKRARGAMARFIIENRLTDPADLAAFTTDGYRHRPDLGTAAGPVFTRRASG